VVIKKKKEKKKKKKKKKEKKTPQALNCQILLNFFINNCMLLEAFELIKNNSSFILIFIKKLELTIL
jgi:hypothetical protein